MTPTKIILGLLCFMNIYIGFRFFLNVIQVLQTSKYSEAATLVFAILFLGIGILGIYFLFIKSDVKLALWFTFAPWALALVFLFLNMILGDYQ